jgi:hypothetical protein
MRNPPPSYEPLYRAALITQAKQQARYLRRQLFQIFGIVWMQAAQKQQEVCHGF